MHYKETNGAYYEFDMGRIRQRLAYLRELLGPKIALAYAVKANTFIIQEMIGLVERFEICSPGESAICDDLCVAPEQTVISGVYKTPGFIEELVAHTQGRIYTVEGNTSYQTGVVANGGAVAKKMYTRDYSSIAGYGRPDYSKVAPIEESKEVQSMYNTVDTCPNWAKPYVAEAVARGYIKGDDKGNLNMDDNKIWCLVVMMRIAGVMA